MRVPEDLKYTENDEWIRVEGDTGTVGVTDYAQDQLSDVVYVEVLEGEGSQLDSGEAFGVVESVKAASDVYMPVGGEIVEVNGDLQDEPERINTDPYGAWMIKLRIADTAELDDLMDAEAYTAYIEERGA
ncbi:MAG: glycine cleavage system protein GcvH [Anaerolineales bacterium]|nr:glycine cleavage system protein GcvH [Anaerolineales bacterium]